jgi:hypothetical protein
VRLVSTLRSSHRGETSLLAIAETVMATAVSLWVAIRYETLIHIAASVVLASMLLFRSRQSDRMGRELIRVVVPAILGWPVKYQSKSSCNPLIVLPVLVATLFVVFVLLPLSVIVCRISATIASLVARPLVHLVSIRKNWRRIALATDTLTLVEIVPGIELATSPPPELRTFSFKGIITHTRATLRDQTRVTKVTVFVLLTPILLLIWLPPMLQRWSFKSVSLFFLPLLFVVNSDVIRPDLTLKSRLSLYTTASSWADYDRAYQDDSSAA